jgi:hypothetical protein
MRPQCARVAIAADCVDSHLKIMEMSNFDDISSALMVCEGL